MKAEKVKIDSGMFGIKVGGEIAPFTTKVARDWAIESLKNKLGRLSDYFQIDKHPTDWKPE